MDGFVNKRANEIWEIVTSRVDFRGKTVVDIGCGPGDFVRLALKSGAKHVTGIDMDYAILLDAGGALKAERWKPDKDYTLLCEDINELVADDTWQEWQADIALCFSCLPYLKYYGRSLGWIGKMARDLALIESQYHMDGPGPTFLKNDSDMGWLLSNHWKEVEKIGSTDVVIRPAARSIWMCKQRWANENRPDNT